MEWDERAGRVSLSFDNWKLDDKDIRAFFKLTTNWAARQYEDIWNESESAADILTDFNDADFEQRVGGLWPDDYQWILRAATIREAVTAFEVYLEKSLGEVLACRLRARVKMQPGRSPGWDALVRGHKLIGVNVSTERVQHIRALRHLLTHQRGELRTEAMRARFAADYLLPENLDTGEQIWDRARVGRKVQLTRTIVNAVLDDLGVTIREVDGRVWAVAWDSAPAPGLDRLISKMNE